MKVLKQNGGKKILSNELRWNPLLGTWIIVSSKRKVRPWRSERCPFCPGTSETGYGWKTLVLNNLYPSLRIDPKTSRESFDIYKVDLGYGYCKVVIETPEHTGDLDDIPFENLINYLKDLKEENIKLCKDKKIKYVACFRNKGEIIGVSLTHPHSQIYALPFIPLRIRIELKNARNFYKEKNECLFCHIIKIEKKESIRLLYSNKSFISFLPFFAMWPYEIHIYSKKHIGNIIELNNEEIEDLADIIKVIVSMYNSLFNFSLPYIMFIHNSPCRKKYPYYHFHIEFYPIHRSKDKLKYAAGIEWGAWTFTYDDIPENKAKELKKALKKALRKLENKGYKAKNILQ